MKLKTLQTQAVGVLLVVGCGAGVEELATPL